MVHGRHFIQHLKTQHLKPNTLFTMARSIERYLRLLPKTSGVRYTERVWYPSADVYRTRDGGWIVKVELAGVSPDEIEISVERDAMRITGSRRCRRSIRHLSRCDISTWFPPV